MCVIVDTDVLDMFISGEDKFKPIWDWLNSGRGKIVYTDTEKFKKEWELGQRTKKGSFWVDLRRTNKLKLVLAEKVSNKQLEIESENYGKTNSNDPHIIALALVSHTKLLTTEDNRLIKDFKHIVKGKIYREEKHNHLLTKDTCP